MILLLSSLVVWQGSGLVHQGIRLRAGNRSSPQRAVDDPEVIEKTTTVIEGMKPGTSGVRKQTKVWAEGHPVYVENLMQSIPVPKSSLNFYTPRLNFVYSDSRVVRSKLIMLVETKKN